MEAHKLQHILMYFINTSLTVSVQRVLFSVLFSSDSFGSGIYLFHMAKEEGKREHKLLEKRLKNPLLKQHEKPLMLSDSSTRNRCHRRLPTRGKEARGILGKQIR